MDIPRLETHQIGQPSSSRSIPLPLSDQERKRKISKEYLEEQLKEVEELIAKRKKTAVEADAVPTRECSFNLDDFVDAKVEALVAGGHVSFNDIDEVIEFWRESSSSSHQGCDEDEGGKGKRKDGAQDRAGGRVRDKKASHFKEAMLSF